MAHDDPPDVPRIGKPIPNAGGARVDLAKLVRYALDPDHSVGRHKATVFQRTLGIEKDDGEYLRSSILGELKRCPVSDSRAPQTEHERFTWEVLVPITGLGARASRTLYVITAWEVIDERPTLVTLRVAPKDRQEPPGSR